MKATVDIEKISPKQAEEFLNSQVVEQRPLRDTWVKTLAYEMTEGKFRLGADAIVLVKGLLGNGQHRMWALIESNTTQQFLVMRTDDEELYKILDCGLKRTVGDVTAVANATAVTAVASMVVCYNQKGFTLFSRVKRPSRQELIEFILEHEVEMQTAVNTVQKLQRDGQKLVPRSVAASFMVLALPKHGARVTDFLHHVYMGDVPDSGPNDLRERLIKMKMQKSKYPSQYVLALFIKVFNTYIAGKRMNVVSIREGEEFPKLA